ncbi:APC family permease [Halorarius halobius]|uniref:APC family permease n=1 Tax=Halorarius halobius TaxID=2962671 RepID=UPI0020CF8FE9|nr:APC family permease [Halorarius halobius]
MSPESQGRQRDPAAELGLLDATMIGMGAMIGAGIFVLTGLAAEIAGPGAILVFALNGVVTAFTGLSYAELASAIPKSGGGYAFVREVFADLPAFVMGWMLWFAYMIAGTLYALGFAPNFLELLHVYGYVPPPEQVGAVAVPVVPVDLPATVALAATAVLLLVSVNAVSTAASGSLETVFTAVKVAILVVFVAFGVAAPAFAPGAEFQPLFTGDRTAFSLLPAMGLTFIAFEGYDLITTVTEEVKNPRKNIPRAIFISLAVTVVVYLAVVTVAIGTLGAAGLAEAGEAGIAAAATSFMPEFPVIGEGGAVIVFGAVFSTLTALNAVVIASSRVAFSMGREGQLLAPVGRIHHRFGTPFVAIVASSVVMLLAVVLPTKSAGNMSSLFFLLSFVVVNGAVIKLRRERPNMTRPYEMPLYPLPPVLGIVLNLALTAVLVEYLLRTDPLALALTGGWILFGLVAYLAVNRGEEESPAGERGAAADGLDD